MTRQSQGKIFDEIPEGCRILLGPEIEHLATARELISPFTPGNLAQCSYDFSAGNTYVIAGGGATDNTNKEPLALGPGSYAGLISQERVKIPANAYVLLGPKRKLSYDGIILLSGSVVDPGYEGHLLFVLYNSSGKKRIIYPTKKVCVGTFFQLDKPVEKPMGPDPSLAAGHFPGEFLDSMANMELPSMVEINEKIKEIHNLERRVLQLEETYTGVTKPIKELAETVKLVSRNVEALTKEGERVLGKLKEHEDKLVDVGTTIREQAVRINFAWVLVLIVITALVGAAIGWWVRSPSTIVAPQTAAPTSSPAR